MESHGQGQRPNRGRGRVALSSVILAKRGSPGQGQSSTLPFPRQNQPGDSRAERENDSNVLEYVVVITVEPFGGFFGRRWLPLNDGKIERQGRYHGGTNGGIPARSARMTCRILRMRVVTMEEPFGGLRRRKVRSAPLPPCGESFSRSLAPPFRTRSASLGSRPRRGNLREDDGGEGDPPAPTHRRTSTLARHSEGAGGDRRIPQMVPP